MEEQLALIREDAPDWRLDEQTRRLGLQGVERARSALRRAEGGRGPDGKGAGPSPTRRAA
jgi:hypothetical protein